MKKLSGLRLLILIILGVTVSSACQRREGKSRSPANTLFSLVPPEKSGIRFANRLRESDSSNAVFYEYYYNGSGVAVGDLNNDGLTDIFFGANMTQSRLYLNKGNLTFTDITKSSGINTSGKWVTGVSFVDINNDGWLDIYLCCAGNIKNDYHNMFYISNGDKE